MNSIVALKIKKCNSIMLTIKTIKEFEELATSEVKRRIDNNEYVLCYSRVDKNGLRKIIDCYKKLVAINDDVLLFEGFNEETTLELLENLNRMYEEISNQVENNQD